MNWLGWWRRFKGQHADARRESEYAGQQVEEADREVDQSMRNLTQTRQKVAPLTAIYQRNMFSDIIRDGLRIVPPPAHGGNGDK